MMESGRRGEGHCLDMYWDRKGLVDTAEQCQYKAVLAHGDQRRKASALGRVILSAWLLKALTPLRIVRYILGIKIIRIGLLFPV